MRIRLHQDPKVGHRNASFADKLAGSLKAGWRGNNTQNAIRTTALINISAGAFSKDSRRVSTFKPEFPRGTILRYGENGMRTFDWLVSARPSRLSRHEARHFNR